MEGVCQEYHVSLRDDTLSGIHTWTGLGKGGRRTIRPAFFNLGKLKVCGLQHLN